MTLIFKFEKFEDAVVYFQKEEVQKKNLESKFSKELINKLIREKL